MILLLGGTMETAAIALGLAEAGHDVLVSTATGTALDVGDAPRIRRRCGRLDAEAMERLIRSEAVGAVVDAAHPYAERLRSTAREVAARVPVPYFRYARPSTPWNPTDPAIAAVRDHAAAAAVACSYGRPVLLTTGSNNLDPYAREAARAGVPLAARVLPGAESLAACRRAGIGDDRIVAERGPFSTEQNRNHIRRFGAGVLVTKESGAEGGFPAKLKAAREEHCRVVVIQRPPEPGANTFGSTDALVTEVHRTLARPAQ